MRSCGTAPPPLWGRSFEKGCISNSERGNLNSSNSSCPMPTGEDGHIGGNAAGVCLTGTKRPSSCSQHTRAFGAGWSGNAGTTALISKVSGSEGSSRSSTASTRRRRPLRSAAAILLSAEVRPGAGNGVPEIRETLCLDGLLFCRMMVEAGSFASLAEYRHVRQIGAIYNNSAKTAQKLFPSLPSKADTRMKAYLRMNC